MRTITLAICAACIALGVAASTEAASPTQQGLSVMPEAMTCLDSKVWGVERRIGACSAAINAGVVTGRDLATAYMNRALAYSRYGEATLASADYRRAIRQYSAIIDPHEPDPWLLFLRGSAYHALADVDHALVDYDLSIRRNPRNAMAFLNRGIVLSIYKRQFGLAIIDFDTVLSLIPNDVEALIYRGQTYGFEGRSERGLADLDRAIALDPRRGQAYVFRGVIEEQHGKPALALADYSSAIALAPNDVDTLMKRAVFYARRSDYGKAIADLDSVLALRPRNAFALYDRGYVRFATGQYESALADFSAAIDVSPSMTSAYRIAA